MNSGDLQDAIQGEGVMGTRILNTSAGRERDEELAKVLLLIRHVRNRHVYPLGPGEGVAAEEAFQKAMGAQQMERIYRTTVWKRGTWPR